MSACTRVSYVMMASPRVAGDGLAPRRARRARPREVHERRRRAGGGGTGGGGRAGSQRKGGGLRRNAKTMRLLRLPQQPGVQVSTRPRAAECAGMVGSSDTAARHAAARACARAAGALDHDTQHRLCVVYSTGLYVMTYFLSLATAATPCWAPPTRARPPPARSLARPSGSRPPRIFLCRLRSTSATPQRCPSRS